MVRGGDTSAEFGKTKKKDTKEGTLDTIMGGVEQQDTFGKLLAG